MKNLRFVFFISRLSQIRMTKLVLSVDCWTQPVWNTKLWHRYEKWMVKTSKIQSLSLVRPFFARFMMTMIMMINNDCFMGALAREQTTTNRAILIVFAVIRFWCRASECASENCKCHFHSRSLHLHTMHLRAYISRSGIGSASCCERDEIIHEHDSGRVWISFKQSFRKLNQWLDSNLCQFDRAENFSNRNSQIDDWVWAAVWSAKISTEIEMNYVSKTRARDCWSKAANFIMIIWLVKRLNQISGSEIAAKWWNLKFAQAKAFTARLLTARLRKRR